MGTAIDRIVVTPRWSGTIESDFYPWLSDELAHRPHPLQTIGVDLQPPSAPDVDDTTRAVDLALGSSSERQRTLALAHSVGCQALLRALAASDQSQPVAATVLVAGWWTVDSPWPTIQPWIDSPFDHARARAMAGRVVVLLSDNDPFTADAQESARLFVDRLGAEIRLVPGVKHFNRSQEPSVLAAVRDLLDGP